MFPDKQTEIWNFETKESKSVGTSLSNFAIYPHLYIVNPDECSACSTEKDCGNGNCIRTGGRDECRCDVGYENQNGDRLLPCDIDECELDYCGFGSCVNEIGTFTCTCPEGFNPGQLQQQCQTCSEEGFGPSGQLQPCEDIDECQESSPDCGRGVCENNVGSFSCICDGGFTNYLHNPSSECGKN